MTSGNEFKLGGNNGNSVDLAKLKSGVTRSAFESDEKMLKIFDAIDGNGNQTLDMDEVTVFTESMKRAANGDETITKQEAQQVFKEQQERAKAQGEDAKKYDIKAKDLFGFVNRFLDASERSNVKSSVVDENGNQTLTYEDGSQEILNKDGSKILVQVIDGKKLTKTLDKEGNITEESITNDETGDTETLSYEGGKLKSHVVKSGTTTSFLGVEDGFSKGKPVKQILGQGFENEEVIEYEYTADNSYTRTSTKGDVKSVSTFENGELSSVVATQYKNGIKVQELSVDGEGTQTRRIFDASGNLKYDAITTKDGITTESQYNEAGRKLQSVMTSPDGTVKAAKYDGKGNTLVVVQNGETFEQICRSFGRTSSELAHTNRGTVHYQKGTPYFQAGETVRISGEFTPDFTGLQGRATAEQVKAQFAADEQKRVAQRLQGKELKEVTVENDYKNWTEYAKDLLRSELGREPSNEEFTDKANELVMINSGVSIPKKGMKIQTTKSAAELQHEQAIKAQQQRDAEEAKQKQELKSRMEVQGSEIAETLYTELRRTETRTVDSNQDFKNALNKINALNVVETFRAYGKKSPNESLAKAISWEVTSSNSAIRSAEGKIFNSLSARANMAGVNPQHIKNFEQQAAIAMNNNNADDLERLMTDFVQAIENRENLSSREVRDVQTRTFSQNAGNAVQILDEIYSDAERTLQNHNETSGWSSKAVHGLRNFYDRNLPFDYISPDRIDSDMNKYKQDLALLKNYAASSAGDMPRIMAQNEKDPVTGLPMRSGEDNFRSAFKRVYGVDYDPVAVEAYSKKRTQYQQAASAYAQETKFNTDCANLINGNGVLSAETMSYTTETGRVVTSVISDKQKVYDRELKNFAAFVGQGNEQNGLKGLNDLMKKAGINPETASIDEKYRFLSQQAKIISNGLHQNTQSVTGGKSFKDIQNEYNHSYATAFGTKNDVQRRVTEYVDSIETSSMILKSGVKIVGGVVIGIATGGTGLAAMATAAGAQTTLSFTVDAADLATSERGGTAEQYLTIARQSAIDGLSQVASGGASLAIKGTALPAASKILLNTASDTVIDMGVEYINTGEVTLTNTLISAVASGVGNTISYAPELRQESRARSVAREMDQMEIRTTDPLNDVPANWATMTPEERSANLRQRQIDHENWLRVTGEPALDAATVERINPDHSRYAVTVTSDEMGGVTTADLGNGVRGIVDDPGHIRVDVTAAQMRHAVADVASLGIDTNSEFGRGLVRLENIQQARTAYSPSSSGNPAFAATERMNQRGSGVTSYGTFRSNQQVIAMGLQDDISLVQDAATLSGKAYSLNDPTKPIDGWNFLSSETAENGFAARAYEKDGKIVIAFRGSDNAADLASDFRMMTGRTPEQLQNASAFVAKIKEQHPDAKIIVTGHSLGGSLTEMVASQYDDVLGITFDAVGTRGIVESAGGALKDNHNTVNYIINGDVLSNADAHVGQVVVTDAVVQGGRTNSPHSIGNFMGNGNNSLAGVEAGVVARTVDANAGQTSLSDLISQAGGSSVKIEDRAFRGIASKFEYDVNTLGADLDALESQIRSVADVEQRAQLQSIVDARRTAITKGTDIAGNSHTLRTMSGDEINGVLARDYGFTEPGFLGGDTPSAEIIVDKPTKLVRVFDDEHSYAKGSWLMPYDQIVGKTPEEIKDFFALPNMPKYIVEVEVPAGTRMFTGLCNPLEGWGNGGGTQFFVAGDVRPKQFGQMRLINGATN